MQSWLPPERDGHLLKVTQPAKQWRAGQGSRKWRIKPGWGAGCSLAAGEDWGWQVSGVETSRRLTCSGQHHSCGLLAVSRL